MKIDGTAAVVTGGASGLGEATARALAARGAKVAVFDRDADKGEKVAAGNAVTKGQRLLTLEAMKMEHGLMAPFDGVVAELNAEAGAQVQVDAMLVKIRMKDGQ